MYYGKRTYRFVNRFKDDYNYNSISDIKFSLTEQLPEKKVECLENKERYSQAQLWTFESFAFIKCYQLKPVIK